MFNMPDEARDIVHVALVKAAPPGVSVVEPRTMIVALPDAVMLGPKVISTLDCVEEGPAVEVGEVVIFAVLEEEKGPPTAVDRVLFATDE